MSSGARLVADAVKTATARQATTRRAPFRWSSWSGSAVTALAGVVAATSLVRRQNTEDELRLAQARVLRSESAVQRLHKDLLDNSPAVAAQIAPIRSAHDVEKRLQDWINTAVTATAEKPKSQDSTTQNKTTFV